MYYCPHNLFDSIVCFTRFHNHRNEVLDKATVVWGYLWHYGYEASKYYRYNVYNHLWIRKKNDFRKISELCYGCGPSSPKRNPRVAFVRRAVHDELSVRDGTRTIQTRLSVSRLCRITENHTTSDFARAVSCTYRRLYSFLKFTAFRTTVINVNHRTSRAYFFGIIKSLSKCFLSKSTLWNMPLFGAIFIASKICLFCFQKKKKTCKYFLKNDSTSTEPLERDN